MKLVDNDKMKIIKTENFNHFFDKKTGLSVTFGKTSDDDPDFCEFGPLIADIEVTTSCAGPNGKICDFCYKSNTPNGKYMKASTFEKLLSKLPKTIGQIAFGVDAQCESNPEFWDIVKICKDAFIVPNVTIADISDKTADLIAENMGACAVSVYSDKDLAYNCIKKLTDRGMNQVNIHLCIHQQNYNRAIEIVTDMKKDSRLEKMNAIVFLALKQKGRGRHFSPMIFGQFKKLVEYVLESGISFGFDSCGAHRFLRAIEDNENYEIMKSFVDPCESTCFSAYFDVDAKFYPCSFCEGIVGWSEGIDVLNCNNFIDDVWKNYKTVDFRESLIVNNRNCPIYVI